ncbi:hypothetical protein BDW69DRAFT_199361 [Aspergillus filifer]
MSFRPAGTDDGPCGQVVGDGVLDTQCNGVVENEPACDRCRQRKTKCNRMSPCSHCTKADAQCTYRLAHKGKEKRQRVLISDVYERRLEQISNRIEELYGIIEQGNKERHDRDSGLIAPSIPRAPSYSLLQSGNLRKSPRAPIPVEGIESAYFAHFVLAARVIETAVSNDPHYGAVDGIDLALNTLRSTVNDQREKNEIVQGSRPVIDPLPSGLDLKDLPMPPLDKIMACLRLAQDCLPNQIYWPFEFGSLGDFTQYVIRACTPGPISDMELIIIHYVLYSLFTQLSVGTEDETLQQDYNMQAATCRESLETILANLSFHVATNTDSICALYAASLHSLHCGTVPTAWTFISRASRMCLDTGLHSSHTMASGPENEVQRNKSLFWAVYALEKAIALRLGIPSTIRDQDISIPRLTLNREMTSLAFNRLPDWIDVASLYGRLYDGLYSPTASSQPNSVRASRTSVLASQLEGMIAARTGYYNQPELWSSHVLDRNLSRFMIHASKAIELSILASIYRGPPTETPAEFSSDIDFSTQCLAAAQAALEETTASIAILSDTAKWPVALHQWINEILLAAPFIPFTILACNVVTGSTVGASHLRRLERVVDGLQFLAQSPLYSSCNRQLRIFKAILDVVARCVGAKVSLSLEPESNGTGAGAISSLLTNAYTDVYYGDGSWSDNEFSSLLSLPVLDMDMAPLGVLQDPADTLYDEPIGHT